MLVGRSRCSSMRNTLVDINTIRTLLKACPFGVAEEMCTTLDQIMLDMSKTMSLGHLTRFKCLLSTIPGLTLLSA